MDLSFFSSTSKAGDGIWASKESVAKKRRSPSNSAHTLLIFLSPRNVTGCDQRSGTAAALAEKLVFMCGQHPSAAKAGLNLWNLAARLEAAPFQNGLQTAFFRKLCSATLLKAPWPKRVDTSRGL
jgi:hypothetical protein